MIACCSCRYGGAVIGTVSALISERVLQYTCLWRFSSMFSGKIVHIIDHIRVFPQNSRIADFSGIANSTHCYNSFSFNSDKWISRKYASTFFPLTTLTIYVIRVPMHYPGQPICGCHAGIRYLVRTLGEMIAIIVKVWWVRHSPMMVKGGGGWERCSAISGSSTQHMAGWQSGFPHMVGVVRSIPKGGAPTLPICLIFFRKLHENEEILGEGGRTSLAAPLLDPPLDCDGWMGGMTLGCCLWMMWY